MRRLAIQTLGPLALWDVADDGRWQRIPLERGGGAEALLAVLVYRRADSDWETIAPHLWDRVDVERHPLACYARVRAHASRLRKKLGDHRDVLSFGERAYSLTGPGSASMQVDWWDFKDLCDAEDYEAALSLFRGLPFQVARRHGPDIGELREQIHNEIEPLVRRCLNEVKASSPETLEAVGPVLRQFGDRRPPEWTPTAELPEDRFISEPVIPQAPAPAPVQQEHRRRPPRLCGAFDAGALFEACPEGEERLRLELDQANATGTHTWWSKGEWLGKFFAFWHKMNTRPCEDVAITPTDDVYDGARFGLSEVDEPKDKATILEAPSFYGDNPKKEILVGSTNWGLAHEWARLHGDELLAHPSQPSAFGVVGRPVYPGIAGVHTLVQTSDGYYLFGLRAPDIAFHERTWSASFEEQVAVEAREFTGPLDRDRTLRDVIEGGLYEEWGIDEGAVTRTSCLAIGREWGRDRFRNEVMLNLSATIIAACQIDLALADVWASLDESAGIEDVDEHRAWAGVRFASRSDVLRFVASAKGRRDNDNLLVELCAQSDVDAEFSLYPRGATTGINDRGLMPTSAARLVLASGWFNTL
jgi:hypothetical protein